THNPKGEATALVVGKDGKVESRVVETDRAIGDAWLVTKGLSGGDRVIVRGVQSVKPGDEVTAHEITIPVPDQPAGVAPQAQR
ncbi:MAG: HlyD family secretion protein, partial [Acetobacteraceae bacterium]|nr:HlyD family secretion protein [Acetobacteraceae bacterium]